jgi:DNA helicase-2/ATP-dependent DNA helicase PcrA
MSGVEPGERGVDPLEGLNGAQRLAATHGGGPLIVLAGPGTGKTRVIVSRIGHLVRDRGVDPRRVLALTFTNKAAGELRDRLARTLGGAPAEAVGAFTFNGFGAHLLRRFADLAGLPHEPSLIDSAQRKRMMRRIVRERGLFRDALATGLDSAIADAASVINAMHCAAWTPESARRRLDERERELDALGLPEDEDLAERGRVAGLREVVSLWEAFDAACLADGVISFDHQLSWTNRLLARSELARAFVRTDYSHIVVDEYQDVNLAQIELLRLVAPPGSSPDLCVVGDDDQAIYGFRGADDRAFPRFEAAWPGATTVTLDENYRSAGVVLAVAGEVIGRAHERFRPDKRVARAASRGDDPPGSGVEAVRLENHRQAGEVIAAMIARAARAEPERALSRTAVITRSWGEAESIRHALEVEGIPTRMARPPRGAEDEGVADVFAWVRSLLGPRQTWPVRRLLRRPPNQVGAGVVTALEQGYEAARSRGEVEPYALWAARAVGGGVVSAAPAERGAVERFAGLWAELRDLATTAPARAVIAEIVRRGDVVHADLLDARARAQRVAAVVALLRFVAERSDRLEEPADLGAFMAYFEDLDGEDQKSLSPGRLDHEGAEGDGAEGNGVDAVQLLTAHGAKGLEFDTVFIPRVESQYGFPSVRKPGEQTGLPEWMARGDAGGRSVLEGLQDEERRLFYVACTRAERRLVLLGVVPKRSTAVNYMVELLGAGGLVAERTAGEVLGPHAGDGVEHEARPVGWDAATRRREAVRSERRVARLEAASALDAADRADAGPAELESAAARLRSAAARLAAVARAEAGEPLPAWIAQDEAREAHGRISASVVDAVAPASAAEAILRPMQAPLHLSFTALLDWEKCPRCYYLKHVLHLPEAEGRPVVVGKAVHAALERFYLKVKEADERGVPQPSLEDLLHLGERAIEDAIGPWGARDEEDAERVAALLRVAHGRLHDQRINVHGVEQKIRFTFEHQGRHTVTAKIDRIDLDAGVFRLVDYKTGGATKKLLEPKADDFQFGIYAMALRAREHGDRLEGAPMPPGTAEYWVLSTGQRGVLTLEAIDGASEKTVKRITSAINGMLGGEFIRGKECWGACHLLDPGGTPS